MSVKRSVRSSKFSGGSERGVCRGCINDYFGNYIHAVHLELFTDSFGTNAENNRK